MLVQFSVGNFLSFKEVSTLNMMASRIREHQNTNVFYVKKTKLIKSAVIYGANSSGKSNLFKGLSFMAWFVRNSSKEGQIDEEIDGVEAYRLSTETKDKPSLFEVVFILEGVLYRYGFEVDKEAVRSEWLTYSNNHKDEHDLFYREGDYFEISPRFKEGKGIEDRTRNNALFLSVVANFKGEISTNIVRWFNKIKTVSGLTSHQFNGIRRKLSDEDFKKKFIDLLRTVNLGIEDISLPEEEDIPPEIKDFLKKFHNGDSSKIQIQQDIETLHKKYDEKNNFIGLEKFSLFEEESEGTKKLISLLGPVLDVLANGYILVVDELDAKLHPIMTRFIINLFHDPEHNLNNAQLIFNSHDTNLLHRKNFRRDQVWFTEKDQYGATDLYSLDDFNVRNDASLEKDYLLGKYGSIPFIGSFHFSKEKGEN